MTEPLSVLHVVESYGAGTATALDQYVRATPEIAHHLIRRYRPDDDHADDGEQRRFASVRDLGDGVFPAVRSVRAAVREIRPDVVHGHSSFGGAFARLGTPRGVTVAYTPHCYATERRDISAVARAGYAAAEVMLSLNTNVVAGCSEREVGLARRLTPRARRVLVPNVSGVEAPTPPEARQGVVTVGRITAQRDPDYFLTFVAALDPRPDVVRWIGGGDPDQIHRLQAAGVEVTGWVPRSQGLALLAGAELYVHTAAWDGTPMTLVEAISLGVPTVARRTAAVADPIDYTAEDPGDLAGIASALLADPDEVEANRAAWASRFAGHTTAAQREALHHVYGAVR